MASKATKLFTKKSDFLLIIISLLFLLITLAGRLHAQVASYTFTQTAGSYTAITGGTVLVDGTSSMDSWASSALTIPSFNFGGTVYTTAYITSNGQLSLGGSAPSSTIYTGISTGVGSGICICPFSADLDKVNSTSASEIRWQTIGNEVIFQWKQVKRYSITESFDFQVRLNTSNGEIKFVYNKNSGPGTQTTYQPEVGIRTSATDYNNRKVGTTAIDWATSIPGTANNSICRFTGNATNPRSFVSGQTYTWAPPIPTITSLGSANGCVGSSLVITGTNFTGINSVKIGGTDVTSFNIDNSTQITAIVGYGTTGTLTVTNWAGTGTSSSSFTINATPSTPGAITNNSPQCTGTGVIFTQGTCSSGTCYWVSSATGTETTNSAATYTTATTAGTYNVWVRSTNGTCWSAPVTSSGVVGSPSSPAITAGTAANITGTSASINGNIITTYGCQAVSAYGVEYSVTNGFLNGTDTPVSGSGFNGLPGGSFSAALSGLSPTTTYYFHAYATNSNGTTYSTQGTFTTTIINDECTGAISLTVGSSCSYTACSSSGAIISATTPSPVCYWGAGKKDVWFSFTVPSSGHVIIDTKSGTITDGLMALYSGTCGSLTWIACDDNSSSDPSGTMPKLNQSGLTPGSIIYIRFYEYSSLTGTFEICLYDPPPYAADLCANAINIPVSGSCNYTIYDNTGTTETTGPSTPSCAGSYYFKDVWFKATVPSSGNIRISTEAGSLTDCEMALYSGTCGSLTEIACNSDYVPGHEPMPFIDIYGRTPGEVIYIRFWDYAPTAPLVNEGTFGICAYDLPTQPLCSSNPAASDACSGAPTIANLNGYCGNTSASYTPDQATGLTSAGFCGSIENNSWLSFVASATTAQFNVSVDNCYSSSHTWSYSTSGIQMQVFGTSDCSTFTAYSNCWFPGIPTDGFVTATGLTPGQTYYLMIDGTFGDNCDYTIGASAGVVLPIELASFVAYCKDGKGNITWSTSSETNNDYFTIERSADGILFDPIVVIDGAGNSNSLLNYKTYDNAPLSGVNYYRLKQTDFDGMYTYSQIVAVNPCPGQNQQEVVISPNPFSENFSVDISKLNAVEVNIQIEDLLGKVVWEYDYIPSDSSSVHVSLGNSLESGYYIIKIKYDDNVMTKKILKYKD